MISRKKPGVAFWATVVVVMAPVLYAISMGPIAWLTGRFVARGEVLPEWLWSPLETAFIWYSAPFKFVMQHSPESVRWAMSVYIEMWRR